MLTLVCIEPARSIALKFRCISRYIRCALTLVCLIPGIAAAQLLPDTPANRARGVVGCTQTSSGINCGNISSGGSYNPLDDAIGTATQSFMQGFQGALKRNNAYTDRILTGNKYYEQGQFEEAIKYYQQAQAIIPNHGDPATK